MVPLWWGVIKSRYVLWGGAAVVLALLVWLAPATADTGLAGLAWRGLLVGAVTAGTAWPLIKAVRHA